MAAVARVSQRPRYFKATYFSLTAGSCANQSFDPKSLKSVACQVQCGTPYAILQFDRKRTRLNLNCFRFAFDGRNSNICHAWLQICPLQATKPGVLSCPFKPVNLAPGCGSNVGNHRMGKTMTVYVKMDARPASREYNMYVYINIHTLDCDSSSKFTLDYETMLHIHHSCDCSHCVCVCARAFVLRNFAGLLEGDRNANMLGSKSLVWGRQTPISAVPGTARSSRMSLGRCSAATETACSCWESAQGERKTGVEVRFKRMVSRPRALRCIFTNLYQGVARTELGGLFSERKCVCLKDRTCRATPCLTCHSEAEMLANSMLAAQGLELFRTQTHTGCDHI